MKKELAIFLSLFFISLASASPILTLNEQTFQPGETMLGTITGNLQRELSSSDISFYQGKKPIFIEAGLTSFNGTYYLYAYPNMEGNFTMVIKNVLYKDDLLNSEDIQTQFQVKANTIVDGNKTFTQILSVKPGFVLTSDVPQISLSNRGNATLNVSYNNEQISLQPGEFKKIQFYPSSSFSFFNISSYEKLSIPVIFTSLHNTSTDSPAMQEIVVVPSFIQMIINENQSANKSIMLINQNLKNISISFSQNPVVFDINNTPQQLLANQTYFLNLTPHYTTVGSFNTTLNIQYRLANTSKNISIPLALAIFPQNYTVPDTDNISSNNSSTDIKSCKDLGGQICVNQNCNGPAIYSLDGFCCIGSCVSISSTTTNSSGSSGWIIGLVLLLVVAIIGFFVYKKYKKTQPQKPDDKIKETSQHFENRISGGLVRT